MGFGLLRVCACHQADCVGDLSGGILYDAEKTSTDEAEVLSKIYGQQYASPIPS